MRSKPQLRMESFKFLSDNNTPGSVDRINYQLSAPESQTKDTHRACFSPYRSSIIFSGSEKNSVSGGHSCLSQLLLFLLRAKRSDRQRKAKNTPIRPLIGLLPIKEA